MCCLKGLLRSVAIGQVFTEKERVRCRLDGRVRALVQIVPGTEPGHVWRERELAMAEGRSLRHVYREMPLTGAPGSRHPSYLLPCNYQRFAGLDDSGHDSESLVSGASEHGVVCETGWVDLNDVYMVDSNDEVCGFRMPNGKMATLEEHKADGARYARNFGVDSRMCHVFNHTHDCKATCFKYDQTKTSKKAKHDVATVIPQRQSCRFRFWRIVEVGGKVYRRLGKALVMMPFVAHNEDDNNEYGRCIVRRQNCFRGSSNDLCQVSLRCNVDLQYQVRTFPEQQPDDVVDPGRAEEEATECGSAVKITKAGTLPRLLRSLCKLLPCVLHMLLIFMLPNIWLNRSSGFIVFWDH